MFFVMILVVFLFVLFGDIIFKIIIDEEFHDAAIYVPMLCMGALIANVGAYVGSTFTVLKKTKYFLYSTIIAALVAIIANMIIVPKFGIMGASVAICLSQLAMFLYRWYKSYKYVNFENRNKLVLISMIIVLALLIFYQMSDGLIKWGLEWGLFVCFMLCNLDLVKQLKSGLYLKGWNK